ncbi:MAG: alternative oxidase [Ilumatobacteraceae bacterium]
MTETTHSEFPVTDAIGEREPFGAMERLSPERLAEEQLVTLARPRRTASLSAKGLFLVMDLLYGKERTLPKFRVLELVARVPYQAWENVAYVAVTHTARETNFARRVFDKVRVSRFEQDNEQWHLLILEELVAKEGTRLGFVRHRVLPQIIAFAYYQLSWIMYAIRPSWSYRLNADFEDHAEHEYALLVQEHPEWEQVPYEGQFVEDYGDYASLADLFRQIGYDERLHMIESESHIAMPRFDSRGR